MDQKLVRFNVYRSLCLENAKASVFAADLLIGNKVNHLAYHLYIHALEEIGKIFIGFYLTTKEQRWDRLVADIPLDDHVKKLFYAIWGPSISKEIISKAQIDENKKTAFLLHTTRLRSLYTEYEDTVPSTEKISDDEVNSVEKFVKSRLNLAEIEGEVNPETTVSDKMVWFLELSKDPLRRDFIFGEKSQTKLIELGIFEWINWLEQYYLEQEKEQEEVAQKEFNRVIPSHAKNITKKWKIKIKICSSSHAIKSKFLQSFNKRDEFVQLIRSDQHALIVEFTLGSNILINDLWSRGFLISRLFVAALNIATNGLFYWNTVIDTERYFESIHDLEENKKLDLKLVSGLKLNWEEKKMFLNEEELVITELVFNYLLDLANRKIAEGVNEFIIVLGLLAKNDIHFRFETEIFFRLYKVFKLLVHTVVKAHDDISWVEFAFTELEKMIIDRSQFDKIMNFAYKLEKNEPLEKPITLSEIISMKQYCGFYFLTLAVRKMRGSSTLKLTLGKDDYTTNEAGSKDQKIQILIGSLFNRFTKLIK